MPISSNPENEDFFNDLRLREFNRLDRQKQVYLDYTGGNLYPESLINQHFESLRDHVFGNPHSTNPSSLLATQLVESARKKVLSYFNADDYYCIFTANASGALQIVGENYNFDADSCFVLSSDNHNSVNGIREYCKSRGGHHSYVTVNFEDLHINQADYHEKIEAHQKYTHKLFAFPAQSNVSGVKHNLGMVKELQEKGWDVLLDAAAYVPSSRLDLSLVKPNFVCASFYKIFGYPTGLGCLLVRKDSFTKLEKKWFAGGTVSFVSVNVDGYYLINNHERFENGTINYLEIPAIENGLKFIESIGIDRINLRVKELTQYLIDQLKDLKHDNGVHLLKIFGPSTLENRGGNIILNFYDAADKTYPFEMVQELSNKENISVRSGCFCNPGIDEINSCVTNEELQKFYSSRDKTDYQGMLEVLGKMRGAIRVSVGLATNKNDLDHFIAFAKSLRNKGIPS